VPQTSFAVKVTGMDKTDQATCRKLLVIDTSYTLEMIRERKIEASVTCRDLGGFFDHVWTVHPFATLLTSEGWIERFGRPSPSKLSDRHTFIEGKIGRYRSLRNLFMVNFLLSQLDLFTELYSLIKRERISVIRVSSPLYVGLFGWLISRLTNIPLVVRVGGNYDKIFETTGQPMEPRLMRSRKVEKIVERFVFRRAELIAGANQDNLNFARANGAPFNRSTLFRYGNLLDQSHLADPATRKIDVRYLAELGIKRGCFLLYVGRLEQVKHPDHVLQVLAEVRSRGFPVKAVLAGEGSMREDLLCQQRQLDLGDAVIMPGSVPQDRLAQLYAAAAVVISPHTGRALSEAAFAAAPVAAYDIDWQGELIINGVTGMLVPNASVTTLASAVEELLADPKFAGRLGAALRVRAREMLDPEQLNAHERAAYSHLLDVKR
jgi:glycosyltransferase involved in cell wall biosynthesis